MIAAFPLLPIPLPAPSPVVRTGEGEGFADLFDEGTPLPEATSPAPVSQIVLPRFDGGDMDAPAPSDLPETPPAGDTAPPALAPDIMGPETPAPPPGPIAPPPSAVPDPSSPAAEPFDAPPPDPAVHKTLTRLSDLAPEDNLGPLQVTVEREGDHIRLVLTAERAETLDLMRRHADQLLADLAREGLGNATFAFARTEAEATPPAPDDATRIDITAQRLASGLDLRL